MAKSNLFVNGSEGDKAIVLGNEAIARGALEAGIGYASMYPGTPASEIIAVLDKNKKHVENLYTEFSLNEHISLHGAIGASWSGIRSLCAMKNVGLNVASEPAQFLAYTGVKAGLVLAIGSDPGAPSSSNEQDDRWYSLHTYMPIMEPSNIQEAKDFTKDAFDVSEEFSFGIVLMAPSRLCHNAGVLRFGNIRDRKNIKGNFKKDPENYLNLFSLAVKNHAKYLERNELLKKYLIESKFNKIINDGKIKRYRQRFFKKSAYSGNNVVQCNLAGSAKKFFAVYTAFKARLVSYLFNLKFQKTFCFFYYNYFFETFKKSFNQFIRYRKRKP